MIKLSAIVVAGLILTGCESRRVVVVNEGMVADPVIVTHRTVIDDPVVVFDPKKDVMTSAGGNIFTAMPSGNSELVAPNVILGPGNYRQNRYSPSIFK